MLKPLYGATTGLLALALLSPALAAGPEKEGPIDTDRPGIADGSHVIGAGHFQIETGVQQEYRSPSHGDEHTLFVPTLLRFGVNDRWEVRIESNGYSHDRTFIPGVGVSRASGYSPLSGGFKYHFQDAKEETRRPSLGAIFRVFPPSGSGGFQTEHVTGDLRLAMDWDFAPRWSLNANAGVAVAEDEEGFVAGLLADTLTYQVTDRFTLFGDVGVQGPESNVGRVSVILDGGAMYLLGKSTQVDFAVGKGTSGRTSPDLFWTVGLSHRF
jgi:hypothetical protein